MLRIKLNVISVLDYFAIITRHHWTGSESELKDYSNKTHVQIKLNSAI